MGGKDRHAARSRPNPASAEQSTLAANPQLQAADGETVEKSKSGISDVKPRNLGPCRPGSGIPKYFSGI